MTRTCLIVEDHADLRSLIRMTLEYSDCDLHEAADAASALAAAQALRPDLFLLDVMMPGDCDGLEVCRRLRADPLHSKARIIMLSARGQADDIKAGLAAGAHAYLVKPFSPRQLLEMVDETTGEQA